MCSMTLENDLGYSFKDKTLLTRALTRKAFALEQKQQKKDCDDQEIFRTLGDAVLKMVLVDLLIMKIGCKTRDDITTRKKKLEREEGLVPVSRKLKIGASIIFGKGEIKQKAEEEPYVLAETLEAVFGAIYLDGGFVASKEVISRLFEPYLINS
jgi:ribonuclease-3